LRFFFLFFESMKRRPAAKKSVIDPNRLWLILMKIIWFSSILNQ